MKIRVYTPCFSQLYLAVVAYRKYENTALYEKISEYYPIPEEHAEAWMVQELRGDILKRYSGKVQCSKILNEPQHWRE